MSLCPLGQKLYNKTMKYAVIATGGKQYRVFEGGVFTFERLVHAGKDIQLDKVLLYVSDDPKATWVGAPFLTGVEVMAEVLEDGKGEKIRVAKFRAKSRHRRVQGHRQSITKVKITSIVMKGEKKEKVSEPKVEKPVRVRRTTKKQ